MSTRSTVPLAIDLFCGLGGWAHGLLEEGYYVVGFDIERHQYGDEKYPGQLVIQDALTLHGSQFKDAAVIVASPPCQAYSYRAMPWKRAKALPPPSNELFDACFRIQREACEAAGRHIPMVVENVRGAQPWVGLAKWNYGSYYLWGDVPALMPLTSKQGQKLPGFRFDGSGKSFQSEAVKTVGIIHQRDGYSHMRHLTNQAESDGVKFSQSGDAWFDGTPRDKMLGNKGPAAYGSKSNSRKAASAMIAKIPFPLSQHLARVFKAEWERGMAEKEIDAKKNSA